MKTAICYVSRHHGNTKKVLDAMKQVGDVELIEIKSGQKIDLTPFDAVGLASGIYFGAFHQSVLHAAQQYLPEGKPVFLFAPMGHAALGIPGKSPKSPSPRAARCGAPLPAAGLIPLARSD